VGTIEELVTYTEIVYNDRIEAGSTNNGGLMETHFTYVEIRETVGNCPRIFFVRLILTNITRLGRNGSFEEGKHALKDEVVLL